MVEPICCTPKALHPDLWIPAAAQAIAINAANSPPPMSRLVAIGLNPTPLSRAAMATQKWASDGSNFPLTVGFLDNPGPGLKAKILFHLNAWSAKGSSASFVESKDNPVIRIARTEGDGHYSYVGTDNLHVPKDEKTMNFDGLTMAWPDAEFFRVIRHEGGHALGFWHEHMRPELVALIDEKKAIRYFGLTQDWSAKETRQQVLTPLDADEIDYETPPDQLSIMCYQLPGSIMKNGKPILGGLDIDEKDYLAIITVYPPKTMTKVAWSSTTS